MKQWLEWSALNDNVCNDLKGFFCLDIWHNRVLLDLIYNKFREEAIWRNNYPLSADIYDLIVLCSIGAVISSKQNNWANSHDYGSLGVGKSRIWGNKGSKNISQLWQQFFVFLIPLANFC